jgi:hypothetical protein
MKQKSCNASTKVTYLLLKFCHNNTPTPSFRRHNSHSLMFRGVFKKKRRNTFISHYCLLRCDPMWLGTKVLEECTASIIWLEDWTGCKNGSIFYPWIWKKQIPPKHWYLSIKLHIVILQKTTISIFTKMRTSYIRYN